MRPPGLPTHSSSSAACRLELLFYSVLPPLPEAQPGCMPALANVHLQLTRSPVALALPPSWGAPGAFSALRSANLELPLAPPLPGEWARGFPLLQILYLSGPRAYPDEAEWQGRPAWPLLNDTADAGAMRLPPEWPSGFPRLEHLEVSWAGLSGSIPATWQAPGGFPSLKYL